jgi:hypothetical protein
LKKKIKGGQMNKAAIYVILLSAFILCACSTINSFLPWTQDSEGHAPLPRTTAPLEAVNQGRDFWDTTPRDGKLIIIGASARLSREADSIENALWDAARKVSFFYGLRGKVETMIDDTGHPITFSHNVKADVIPFDYNYEKFKNDLQFDYENDVYRYLNSIFVKVRYTPQEHGFYLDYVRPESSSTPSWITKPPPEISGYKVGVGRANPHQYYRDTVIVSYEDAAAALFNTVELNVRSVVDDLQTNYYNSASMKNIQVAEAALENFYVLDIWEDPKDKSVWTLAIAKEFENN